MLADGQATVENEFLAPKSAVIAFNAACFEPLGSLVIQSCFSPTFPDWRARRTLQAPLDRDSDAAGDNERRSFTYDPNGRLLTASGPWSGTAFYVCDPGSSLGQAALGNLTKRREGAGSLSTMSCDATNRVSSAVIFCQNWTFGYDARGNTTNNGDFAFASDPA